MFRLGLSGGGYWGANIARALRKIPDVALVGVADPDAGARNRIASLFNGDIHTHANFEYLLSDKIDGVIIATPPALHVEQAVAALGRGKDVFVEKPPAMTLHDLDRLLGAACGKTLSCDYIYCHNALIRYAAWLMEDKNFRLVTANLRWVNWGIVRKDVDAYWSVMPHPVSVLCYLFGQKRMEVDWCKRGDGFARSQLSVDGGDASAFVSWGYPMKERRIELVGVNRTILIEDVAKKVWVMKHDDLAGGLSTPNVRYGEPLVDALSDFVACAKSGQESITGPRLIERVTRLMCNA